QALAVVAGALKTISPSLLMPKLRSLAPRLRLVDTSTTKLLPKVKGPIYQTLQFQAWRAQIIGRAGGRCEAVDRYGHRCSKSTSHDRMYADHVTELVDGGSPFDLANGQCLCASHHAIKTMAMRSRRLKGSDFGSGMPSKTGG